MLRNSIHIGYAVPLMIHIGHAVPRMIHIGYAVPLMIHTGHAVPRFPVLHVTRAGSAHERYKLSRPCDQFLLPLPPQS